jgi:hypothetical protein
MKTLLVMTICAAFSVFASGQTLSPTVISTAGDYYTGTAATLSVTIGEPVVETYTSGSNVLSTGFQQSDLMKQLQLTLNLEGLWNGTTMNKAQGTNGNQYPGNIADKITVELRQASNYNTLVFSANGIDLSTGGQAAVRVPGTKSGSYYLAVKHRNSIETVSAAPVSFSGMSVNYNFSDNISKAYGNNLKLLLSGVYGIFTGDINGDGSVNVLDLSGIGTDASNFVSGYINTDLNGDGIIDALDLIPTDNNAAGFVSAKKP